MVKQTELTEGYEIIGTLTNIETVEGIHKLSFTIQHTVEVPTLKIQSRELHALKGKRVSVLRIDNKLKVQRILK